MESSSVVRAAQAIITSEQHKKEELQEYWLVLLGENKN